MVLCTESPAGKDTGCPGVLTSLGILTLTSACLVFPHSRNTHQGLIATGSPSSQARKGARIFSCQILGACSLTEWAGRLGQFCKSGESCSHKPLVHLLPVSLLGQGVLSSSWAQALLEDSSNPEDYRCWRQKSRSSSLGRIVRALRLFSPASAFSVTLPEASHPHLHLHKVPCASRSPCFQERSQDHAYPQELNSEEFIILCRAGGLISFNQKGNRG